MFGIARHKKNIRFEIIRYFLTLIVFLFFFFPIVYTILTSFKQPIDAFSIPPKLLFTPTLENYIMVFRRADFSKVYFNSVAVTVCSTLVALVPGVMAGYALSRYRFRAKEGLATWVLATRMGPPVGILLPIFIFAKTAKLLDTLWILIALYSIFNLSFVVWIMRSFFDEIPIELDEAAQVDGASLFDVIRLVVFPLAAPGMVATAIFCVITSWNEFLWAFMLTNRQAKTLPVMMNGFITEQGILWGQMSAASMIVVIPIFIFALIIQKNLVRGMTFGAVKQ
jgi:multiple sugar transport system permease protein